MSFESARLVQDMVPAVKMLILYIQREQGQHCLQNIMCLHELLERAAKVTAEELPEIQLWNKGISRD